MMSATMKAMSRVHDVRDTRGFLRKRLLAVGLTLVFSVFVLAATALLATGALMAGGLGGWLGWGSEFKTLWNVLTPVLAIALVLVGVSVLYWLAPNTTLPFHLVTPGAVLFVGTWIIFSVAFTLYVSNFGSYNRVYGSLAAMMILLIWLYWSNILLLVGAELNAVLAQRKGKQSGPET
jgi:membrane protein